MDESGRVDFNNKYMNHHGSYYELSMIRLSEGCVYHPTDEDLPISGILKGILHLCTDGKLHINGPLMGTLYHPMGSCISIAF